MMIRGNFVYRPLVSLGVLVLAAGCSASPSTATASTRVSASDRALGAIATARASLSADPTAAPEVLGVGTGMVEGFAVSWSNAMQASAGGGPLVNYSETGSTFGRDQWAKGKADFTIAGRPLNDQDRQSLASRKTGVIEAPVAVSAMTFLMSGPAPSPLRLVVPGPTPDDPFAAQQDWTDPIRVPNELLARIFLEKSVPLANEPGFVAQIPSLPQIQPRLSGDPAPGLFQLQGAVRPVIPVVRSDPGAVDYYLNKFVEVSAPTALQEKATAESIDLTKPTEAWRFVSTPSRSGDGQIAGLVSGWLIPDGSNLSTGGTVGPVSPSAVFRERFVQGLRPVADRTPLYVLEVQNGAGAYVAPTTATITRGAELSQGDPLAQLVDSSAAPDAYPLTWISNMYVQSSGLSIEKTSIIATLIRYGVTAGQAVADQLNEGRLPATEVVRALAAADAVVTGNCVGADRKVVIDSAGGAYWPAGVVPPTGGARVCVSSAAPGVEVGPVELTTSAPRPVSAPGAKPSSATGRSPVVPRSRFSGGSTGLSTVIDGGGSALEQPLGTSPSGEAPAQRKVVPAGLAAATLPLNPPDDGRKTLDRLSTMLLGGLALLVVRAVVRRRQESA